MMKKLVILVLIGVISLSLSAQTKQKIPFNVSLGSSMRLGSLDTWRVWFPSLDAKISVGPIESEFFYKYSASGDRRWNILGVGGIIHLCPVFDNECHFIVTYDRTLTNSGFETRFANGNLETVGFRQHIICVGVAGGQGRSAMFFRAGVTNESANGRYWGLHLSGGVSIYLNRVTDRQDKFTGMPVLFGHKHIYHYKRR
jgi:hypothetical protein